MARPGLIAYYNWLKVKSPYKVLVMKNGYVDLSAKFGGNLLVWSRTPDVTRLMIRGAHARFYIISSDIVHAGISGEVQEVSCLPELRRLYYKFLEDNWQT